MDKMIIFLDFLPSGAPVTPDVFAAVRGDLNVEFRLAKKDPQKIQQQV